MAHKGRITLDMMQGLSQGTQFPEHPNYPLNSPNLMLSVVYLGGF
jgi:hypothetical protein